LSEAPKVVDLLRTLTKRKMPPKKKGDGKGGPKPGTQKAKAVAEKAGEVKKQVPEEPKKPSVKEVIGGASWTGKLPVNMLAEHCQKQKWEKPEYSMVFNFSVALVASSLQSHITRQALIDYDNFRLKPPMALCLP
jgi:hypothetical protein